MSTAPVVELCAITDGDYAIPTVVMLTSAKVNKAPESRYRVHLMLTSPNSFVEKLAKELHSPDFEMQVRHVELTVAERRLSDNRHFSHISGTTLVRCRLGSLLPTVPRVLYLDGDILIRGDLTSFFHMDMESRSLAGVWDAGEWDGPGTHSRSAVGAESYVNAGVLLLNLERMRENGLAARIEQAEENPPPEWQWADQDIINACCPDEEKLILPPRYNSMIPQYQLLSWNVGKLNAFYGTHYSCMMEFEVDSLVLHLAGPQKPWNLLDCYGSELWMQYYKASPFRHGDWQRKVKVQLHEDEPLRLDIHRLAYEAATLVVERAMAAHTQQLPHVEAGARGKTAEATNTVCDVRLLGLLPLLRVQKRDKLVRVQVLGFLPLLKIIRVDEEELWQLFHFLPLFRIRRRKK